MYQFSGSTPDLTGTEAILLGVKARERKDWVAQVDEISEGFASSLDLVEDWVKVQCRGQHRKNHQEGSGCLHPTWDLTCGNWEIKSRINKCAKAFGAIIIVSF